MEVRGQLNSVSFRDPARRPDCEDPGMNDPRRVPGRPQFGICARRRSVRLAHRSLESSIEGVNEMKKLALIGGLAAGCLATVATVSGACSVWWQSKCCTVNGVATPIRCTDGTNFWTCNNILISDPAVGRLSSAAAGWTGPFLASFKTCEYYRVACGPSPQLPCIYALPSVTKSCTDVAPPTTPPNCP
jgi:hypothetical protein